MEQKPRIPEALKPSKINTRRLLMERERAEDVASAPDKQAAGRLGGLAPPHHLPGSPHLLSTEGLSTALTRVPSTTTVPAQLLKLVEFDVASLQD
jgi:hypothetical protein